MNMVLQVERDDLRSHHKMVKENQSKDTRSGEEKRIQSTATKPQTHTLCHEGINLSVSDFNSNLPGDFHDQSLFLIVLCPPALALLSHP